VEPIVMAQDGFNASLVRMMNQMSCYIDEQNKEIEDLKKLIEKLESK
jgi:ferritin